MTSILVNLSLSNVTNHACLAIDCRKLYGSINALRGRGSEEGVHRKGDFGVVRVLMDLLAAPVLDCVSSSTLTTQIIE